MRQKELKTVNDLKAAIKFGENCKRCMPYIERMVETGETDFAVMPFVAQADSENAKDVFAEEAGKKPSM